MVVQVFRVPCPVSRQTGHATKCRLRSEWLPELGADEPTGVTATEIAGMAALVL